MLLASSSSDGPPLQLLLADRRRTESRMAALQPLLWQVLGAARARIETLRLARELAEVSARLEARACVATPAGQGLRLAEVAVENSSEGVVFTDPELGIQAMNRAFREITGCADGEGDERRRSLFELGHHAPAYFDAIRRSLAGCGRWQGEMQVGRQGGVVHPEQLSISAVHDDRGRVENYVGIFSNAGALRQSEARFDFLSHHDPLTGLPNRLLFDARGEHALAGVRRGGGRLAVMCLALDLHRSEHLDDTLGHPAGDGLLRKAAERVVACLHAGDTVGRARGDEFTVLLEELPDAGAAAKVARRILDALAAPFDVGGNELVVSACVGVSVFPEDGDDLGGLLRQASTAMHRAREQARGGLEFYTAELHRTAVERLRLESDLRQALRGDELVLHYQPQVSVRTGAIVGVEALVRWRHPELGLIYPARFIPLAEENGLAEGVGAWVLRAACRQASQWRDAGLPALRVAVNLSAGEISSTTLIGRIAAALGDSGLDPAWLEIEITEGSVMVDLEAAIAALAKVKSLGVTIALDDFGSGYSALGCLRRFPIDRLKLDGSFLREIADDESAQAIARAAIALGHGLRADLVAEGVESAGQLDFLRESDCDTYQGHFFSAALPPAELAPLLRARAN